MIADSLPGRIPPKGHLFGCVFVFLTPLVIEYFIVSYEILVKLTAARLVLFALVVFPLPGLVTVS